MINKDISTFWRFAKKLSILFFLVLLLCGIELASELLYPSNDIIRNWQSFYAQDKDSIDFLIVGSSHAYSSFDVNIFDNILEEKTYILASNSQTVTQSYYNVKEVLKYQKPKTILLEASCINGNANWQNGDSESYDKDWKKESNIDGMRFGLVKLEAIAAQYTYQNWPYALIRISRSHQNWKDLVQIKSNLDFLSGGAKYFNGFRPSVSTMSKKTMKKYKKMKEKNNAYTVCEENIDSFHKLAELCRENDIELILVMAPMYDGYIKKINYESRYEVMSQLAQSENVQYIDCNKAYNEIGLEPEDFEDVYSTYIHLNTQGAEKVSYYVVEGIGK